VRLLLFEAFKKKTHNLAGVAVVVDNRILLVHPKKFKRYSNKWSIPKGHVESRNSLISALKELREETGIRLNMNYDDFIELEYSKSGFDKKLEVYIYKLSKSDIDKYLDKGWKIKDSLYDRREILKSQFIDIDRAYTKVEPFMLTLLDYLKESV
jgi:8-oxo-dGTP pyrophosphatase MutT (NUDIX family)